MSGGSPRWQGQKSAYPWEQLALDHIKSQMPDAEPYRAWQTFTFTAASGHVREVDLFIATPGGLFLVEIKSHPGKATNNGSTWLFRDGSGTRTIENPLHFTDQKAKELRGQLDRAAKQLKVREHIPRIEAVVFLSAENLECHFDEFQRHRVSGRDDRAAQTTLPGIWRGFLSQPPSSERNRVTPTLSRQLPKLFAKIGISRLHKMGKVGPYELEPKSFDAGPTWEDYLAINPSLPNDQPRRIRVYLSQQGASDDEKKSAQRAARREYLALQGIAHDGIVRAEQYSDELLAGPAVVFRHGKDWQCLDHYMATQGKDGRELPLETRLEMIRQLAEALDHAHRRHLYHRALAPRSVYVELDGRYPRLHIADWQVAARPHGTTSATTHTSSQSVGPAALLRHVERSAGPYLAPEFTTPDAPPVLLDVFGLGALSYLILTGHSPASDREQLARKLTAEGALIPSAVTNSVDLSMDTLVRDATQVHPADRTETVRDFLRELDGIEEQLTAPDAAPESDPLLANAGDEIAGYTVRRVLGKGSTSRALMVEKPDVSDSARVLKVALNDAAGRRLEREAEQLGQLTDSHVARLLDHPFEVGPQERRRKVIGVEYVGDHTLAEELRQRGPLAMTIHELERLGEDLFQACEFLDRRGVWHRDIKPENLALRKLKRKGRELVLFDFSLAGTPDTELGVGTKDYLDPFLGTGRRDRYDQAAEQYAVAVTLHEMVSGELPSWGDNMVSPTFLGPDEEVQLAEDVFDPVIRDGLVAFFKKALHRDARQRFGSLHAMTRAWTDIFRDVETVPPLTTASTLDDDEQDLGDDTKTVQARREEAALKATPATPLVAAGLSPYALSIALQHLGVSTAGELARIPARRITSMKGIGAVPRYELVRRSRDWRRQFQLSEADLPQQGQGEKEQGNHPERTRGFASDPAASESVAGPATGGAAQELAHLSVDEVVRRLVPDSLDLGVIRSCLAVGTDGRPRPAWPAQREIAAMSGVPEVDVAAALDRLHTRWRKSVPALTLVRDDVAEILREHGRLLDGRQLAAGLLARRGSELGDSAERLRLAAICVRAAVETEERLDAPRMVSRRGGPSVLVALTDEGEKGTAPIAGDLFAYAELLGEEADKLAARDPLPGVTEIRQVLRAVITADHATRLSDTDLVLLAAAASDKAAATARLELYPRDLSAERALKISQAGSLLGIASDAELRRRVLARFPALASPPKVEDIPRLIKAIGYDATRGTDGLLHLRSSTVLSGSRGTVRPASGTAARLGLDAVEHARQRLDEARRRGGFVAVKANVDGAAGVCDELAGMEGVAPVNVAAQFVRILREVVTQQGRPRWDVVLAADSGSASPAARSGFAALLGKTWERLDVHLRAAGNGGIVLLHDATPLARYTGGIDLLMRLAVAARDAGELPHGLWLLCPMTDPKAPPRLDGVIVGVIPGDAEQLYVPDGFAGSGKELKVS